MSSTDLIEAVRSGVAASVKAAIAAGADVNQQDAQGWTPLCWAAGKGALEIVALLVEHGADLRRTGRDGRTPLRIALAAGHVDAARQLRDAEAQNAGGDGAAPVRSYCKAFSIREVGAFAGWPLVGGAAPGSELVYVHQNLQVTRSMWPDEDVVLDGATPGWREFCHTALGFRVPDDLELIGRP